MTAAHAANAIIQAAKAGDVSTDTAIDLHTADLSRDELATVLKLIFPFMVTLYAAKAEAAELLDALDANTFDELAASLNIDASGVIAEVDPMRAAWDESSADGLK